MDRQTAEIGEIGLRDFRELPTIAEDLAEFLGTHCADVENFIIMKIQTKNLTRQLMLHGNIHQNESLGVEGLLGPGIPA
ncbi:MAG: hypothetical protein WD342_16755 [Verrucomicrobiales bacterium]